MSDSAQIPLGHGFPQPLSPDDVFYRAIRPEDIRANGVISSKAFAKASANRKLSVDWAALCSAQDTYQRWPHWGKERGVAAITAQLCWDCQQQIAYAPTEDNSAHSEVFDQPIRTLGRLAVQRALARGALLVVPPQP